MGNRVTLRHFSPKAVTFLSTSLPSQVCVDTSCLHMLPEGQATAGQAQCGPRRPLAWAGCGWAQRRGQKAQILALTGPALFSAVRCSRPGWGTPSCVGGQADHPHPPMAPVQLVGGSGSVDHKSIRTVAVREQPGTANTEGCAGDGQITTVGLKSWAGRWAPTPYCFFQRR